MCLDGKSTLIYCLNFVLPEVKNMIRKERKTKHFVLQAKYLPRKCFSQCFRNHFGKLLLTVLYEQNFRKDEANVYFCSKKLKGYRIFIISGHIMFELRLE